MEGCFTFQWGGLLFRWGGFIFMWGEAVPHGEGINFDGGFQIVQSMGARGAPPMPPPSTMGNTGS